MVQIAPSQSGQPIGHNSYVPRMRYAYDVSSNDGHFYAHVQLIDLENVPHIVMGDNGVCPMPWGACVSSATGGTVQGYDMYGQRIRVTLGAGGESPMAFASIVSAPDDTVWINQYGLPYAYLADDDDTPVDIAITPADADGDTRGTFSYSGAFGSDDTVDIVMAYEVVQGNMMGDSYGERYASNDKALAHEWLPLIKRTAEDLDIPANLPALFPHGYYGGEGDQWMHGKTRSIVNPNIAYLTQDVSHGRITEDGGITWRHTEDHGLFGLAGRSCKFDPASDRVLFAVYGGSNAGSGSVPQRDLMGLYVSLNRGYSWTQVISTYAATYPGDFTGGNNSKNPVTGNSNRWIEDLIVGFPVVGGTPETRRWKVIIPLKGVDGGNSDHFNVYETTGANGGLVTASWGAEPIACAVNGTTNNVVPSAGNPRNFGRPITLVQHPVNVNEVLLCTTNGIWRTTTWDDIVDDDTFDAAFTHVEAIDGGCSNAIYDPDDPTGATVIAASQEFGVGISTDHGATWTWTAPAGLVKLPVNIELGARFSNNVQYRYAYLHSAAVESNGGASDLLYSLWNGVEFSPWMECACTGPGHYAGRRMTAGGGGRGSWDFIEDELQIGSSTGAGDFGFCMAHPTNPNNCISFGWTVPFLTNNGPLAFQQSSSGLDAKTYNTIYWTDVPGEAFTAHSDYGVLRTQNNFLTLERDWHQRDFDTNDATDTGYSVAVMPRNSGIPAPMRGAVFYLAGQATQGAFILSYTIPGTLEAPSSWIRCKDMVNADLPNNTIYGQVDISRDDPSRVYAGQYRSSNYGQNFELMATIGGNPVYFCYLDHEDGERILGYYNDGGTQRMAYSPDGGATWPITDLYNRGGTGITNLSSTFTSMVSDPTNFNRLYHVGQIADKDLYVIHDFTDSLTSVPLGLYPEMFGSSPPSWVEIDWRVVAVDELEPRNIYVSIEACGYPCVFWGRWNASFTSIVWTDITGTLCRSPINAQMWVDPYTSWVFYTSNVVSAVRPPLDGRNLDHPNYATFPRPIKADQLL